jgi:DNA polymerase III subunit epsilon
MKLHRETDFKDLPEALKICWIDVETTGTYHWQHSIVQIAGIIEIDGVVKKEFNLLSRPHPKAKIEKEALEVNKRTVDEIMAYPPQLQAYLSLVCVLNEYVDKFNKSDKFYFAGYNSNFDNNFVRAFFKQCEDNFFGSYFWSGTIDVMVLALDYFKGQTRKEMDNFQLMTVAKQIGLDIDKEKAHDALYDIRVTRDIYYKLKQNQQCK